MSRPLLCLAALAVVLAPGDRIAAQVSAADAPPRPSAAAASAGGDGLRVADFLAASRAGAARYRDRAAAVRDGYRLIGPDFPGMGEHWIDLARVFARRLDPTRPAVLTYATIDGAPRLIGVAFVVALPPGASPPSFPAPTLWHDHRTTIDEEAILIDHLPSRPADTAWRLAMLHAWVVLENPAGAFAADNWALPFVRAGFAAPTSPPPEGAARALSLLSGGDAYHELLLTRVGAPDERSLQAIRNALNGAREAAATIVRGNVGRELSESSVAQLDAAWRELWIALAGTVADDVRERLAPLFSHQH